MPFICQSAYAITSHPFTGVCSSHRRTIARLASTISRHRPRNLTFPLLHNAGIFILCVHPQPVPNKNPRRRTAVTSHPAVPSVPSPNINHTWRDFPVSYPICQNSCRHKTIHGRIRARQFRSVDSSAPSNRTAIPQRRLDAHDADATSVCMEQTERQISPSY